MTLVSVVLPVYNGAQFIQESVQSILDQTHQNLCLIIVDDGSTDDTPRICANFEDTRVNYKRLPVRSGTAAAMNVGYESLQGEYVAHMDADDISNRDRIQQQVAYLQRYRSIDVLGTRMRCFGASTEQVQAPSDDAVIKANLLPGFANILNPTAMIRRSFFDKAGLKCDPTLGGCFDWGFWVAAMLKGARFANLADSLVNYRIHENQQSRDQSRLRTEQSRIRTDVLKAYYPSLTLDERLSVEPLLQWIQPPALAIDELDRGLRLCARLKNYSKQSKAKEDRPTLNEFIARCINRWEDARSAAFRE